MTIWLTAVADFLAALVALPCFVVFAQCVVAVWPARSKAISGGRARPSVGILVPAHNEEAVIRSTLQSIVPQLQPADRLLVVADNCSDATALIASEFCSEVIERNDSTCRGKGYALQAGLGHWASNPPAVVIVVDADCRVGPNAVEALVSRVAETGRPVQARYLMAPPLNPRAVDCISSLAVLVKNQVRPFAMARLGLPCLITGSGSAFPWTALQTRSFAGENIVEDMQLAIDMALAGLPPTYCDEADVTALLPDQHSAFVSQRRRWEHGHLQTLRTQVPRLLVGFLKSGRPELIAMAGDLAVPPLSLLVAMGSFAFVGVLLLAALGASLIPLYVIAVAGLMLCGAIFLAWRNFAREWIPFRNLRSVPVYVAMKLPLYAAYLFRRQQAWIRTPRQAIREESE